MRRLSLILLASLFSTIYCLPASAANEILINEVELNPPGTDSCIEKAELYNPSNSTIDVSGWTISSTTGTAATIVINQGTTIPTKGYLIVGSDSQQWLDNTGEVVQLMNDSGMLIDSVGHFSDEDNDEATWQRSPDGEDIGSFQAIR